METSLIIGFHHIIITIIAIGGVMWGAIKLSVKAFKVQLEKNWDEKITILKKDIQNDRTKDLEKLNKEINEHCGDAIISKKINDIVKSDFELLKRDTGDLKDNILEIKQLMSNQQETLLAIQLNLTEMKPRVVSLEKRVEKLENKIDV
jgi:peptidoglycan hydrolase CwlO-like protein